MSATSYLVTTNRYVKRGRTAAPHGMTATAPAISEALTAMQAAEWVDALWAILGTFPDHTGLATDDSDFWDAYAVCTDINATTGAQNVRLGCVAYRVALPAAAYAEGKLLVSVGVTISGDPYLVSGARVAVALSATATPATDWATIVAGDAFASAASARTTAVVSGLTRWYPATSTQTIILAAEGVQAQQYIWIYLSLEDYASCARMPWVEGGAALGQNITITFADAVGGGLTPDSNIGGRVEPADIVAPRMGPKCGFFCFAAQLSYDHDIAFTLDHASQTLAAIERFWANNTKQTTLSADPVLPTGLMACTWMTAAGMPSGRNLVLVVGGVMPIAVMVPARRPIKRIILPAPTAYDELEVRVSAYWVDGVPADADASTVPNTDPLFWLGESLTPTIGGLPGLLLGSVRLVTAPAGPFSIPVTWPGYATDKYGYIYLVCMPANSTTNDLNLHGIGTPNITTPSPLAVASTPWVPASILLSSAAS